MSKISRYLLLAIVTAGLASGLAIGMAQIAATQSAVTLASSINQTWGRLKVEDIFMCANGTEAWVAAIGPGSLDDLELFRLVGVNGPKPKVDGGSVIFFGDNDDFGPGPGIDSPSFGGQGTGIPGGMGPRGYPGLAMNTGCTAAYVPNFFLGSVVKVDLETGIAATATNESGSVNQNDGSIVWPANYGVDHLTVDGLSLVPDDSRVIESPVDAQLNSTADSRLVVSASKGNAVYVLDTATGKTMAKIATGGSGPGSVAVIGAYALVVQSSRSVACVDLTSNTLSSTISGLGINPFMVVASGNGNRAYVSNQSSSTVTVIEGGGCSKSVVATIDVGTAPRHLTLSQDSRFLYVANALDNTVSVIDTRSLEVVETINVASGDPAPLGIVAISNNNRYLLAFYEGGRSAALGRFQIRVYDVSGLYAVP